MESKILGFGIRNYAIRNPSSTGKESDAGMTSMESSIQDTSYKGRIVVFNHSSKYSLDMPDTYWTHLADWLHINLSVYTDGQLLQVFFKL